MIIGILKENQAHIASAETRVAGTPESVKKLLALGHTVRVEADAGLLASYTNEAYLALGASIVSRSESANADIVLCVNTPNDLSQLKTKTVLIGMLNPFDTDGLAKLNAAGLTAFALEAAPRTSRAQSMDVLSSQANVAGYKAVLMAAAAYPRFMPMLMTAAGTVKAARVVVLGVGVAGLQAIATAKRLGAVIEASDVRPATKEQVESLGAKFIDVPYETAEEKDCAVGVGGYAKPMPQSWLVRQKLEVAKRVAAADIVITTALIPGRTVPELVTAQMVASMKPGAVIVDMAAGRGENGSGNCALTEAGKNVIKHGVTIIGETNIPALVAADASALYARNVLDFLKLIINKDGALHINLEDDIVKACLMCQEGVLLRN